MTTTEHYGLRKVGPGETIADNSFQYSSADRDKMDLLLYLGAEAHRHTGGASTLDAPADAPILTLDTTSGAIPAGTTVRYVYTYIDPTGLETVASPEAFIDTPALVDTPSAPTLEYLTTGGTLEPGAYYYILSAYTGATSFETLAENAAYISIPLGATTNLITITLPPLPSGADGFNIYRRKPGNTSYVYLDSVNMNVATPPTVYVDDGSVDDDDDRRLPVANTTDSANSITVTLTDPLPAGYSWRIYRTYVADDWTNSVLATLTGDDELIDTGTGTAVGQPPESGVSPGNPTKIDLNDGAEVQGVVALANSTGLYPVEFYFDGLLEAASAESAWICPFDQAQIIGVILTLGPDFYPVADDLIVDVLKGTGTSPSFTSVYTTNPQPTILVGDTASATLAAPNTTALALGDSLTCAISQPGGGATPNDRNLTVVILLATWRNEATSRSWS